MEIIQFYTRKQLTDSELMRVYNNFLMRKK